MVNINLFKEIVGLLEGIDYAFFSGLAMEVYTQGERKARDFDIIVSKRDIQKFAEIIGCKLFKRKIVKEGYRNEDYGGVIDYRGQEIEITTGFPRIRMIDGTIKKIFDGKIKMKYLGLDVFVVPIEETIAFKAVMHREKDIADLKLLKSFDFDPVLVREFARDCKREEEVVRILREKGFEV